MTRRIAYKPKHMVIITIIMIKYSFDCDVEIMFYVQIYHVKDIFTIQCNRSF